MGIFYRGGKPIQHYLLEELFVRVRDEINLEVRDIGKMEYDWNSEMEDEGVPERMADPFPWDWLALARIK